MIHGHGEYFVIIYCKNINKFAERFVHILLKIIVYNRMLMPRVTASGSGLEMQIEALKELRVAC